MLPSWQRFERTLTWNEANPKGCWRSFSYEEVMARDKATLDIFWMRDELPEESDSLPGPDVLAGETMEELKASLEQFGGLWRNWETKKIEKYKAN